MGVLAVMGVEGDTKLIWTPGNADEVENAKRTFKDLKKKGYIAYYVEDDGERGEVITEFDPMLSKIIMAPPMRGG